MGVTILCLIGALIVSRILYVIGYMAGHRAAMNFAVNEILKLSAKYNEEQQAKEKLNNGR